MQDEAEGVYEDEMSVDMNREQEHVGSRLAADADMAVEAAMVGAAAATEERREVRTRLVGIGGRPFELRL